MKLPSWMQLSMPKLIVATFSRQVRSVLVSSTTICVRWRMRWTGSVYCVGDTRVGNAVRLARDAMHANGVAAEGTTWGSAGQHAPVHGRAVCGRAVCHEGNEPRHPNRGRVGVGRGRGGGWEGGGCAPCAAELLVMTEGDAPRHPKPGRGQGVGGDIEQTELGVQEWQLTPPLC